MDSYWILDDTYKIGKSHCCLSIECHKLDLSNTKIKQKLISVSSIQEIVRTNGQECYPFWFEGIKNEGSDKCIDEITLKQFVKFLFYNVVYKTYNKTDFLFIEGIGYLIKTPHS